jgi:mannose-6-phosphate isomerase-like protein (cupin superfamily)
VSSGADFKSAKPYTFRNVDECAHSNSRQEACSTSIMKHLKTGKKRGKFDLLTNTRNLQAAMMTLRPGGTSDDEPSNEHASSEQWLFVLSGSGEARIGKRRGQLRRVKIEENSLLVIEKGELHQIRNTGKKSLRTINFYAPPAYDADGEPISTWRKLIPALSE